MALEGGAHRWAGCGSGPRGSGGYASAECVLDELISALPRVGARRLCNLRTTARTHSALDDAGLGSPAGGNGKGRRSSAGGVEAISTCGLIGLLSNQAVDPY